MYGNNCIGQVLRIIDNRTVIVSTTKPDLHVNDKIIIYEPSEPIFDLAGNKLCNYEYTKDKLDVIEVNEHYSICQKNEIKKRTSNIFEVSPILSTTKLYKPLNVDEDNIEPFEIKNRTILKGDPIKLAWQFKIRMIRYHAEEMVVA